VRSGRVPEGPAWRRIIWGGGERLQVGPDMTAKRRQSLEMLSPVGGRELQRFAS
jgi:hypothetical protein